METILTRGRADRKPSRFYGKAEDAANAIVRCFQAGDLPKVLSPIFIRRKDNVPCRSWSWSNQLLVAIFGHSDARGYRQWQAVGRHVRKGEKSFPILVPLTKKVEREDKQTGETVEGVAVYGFKHAAVFGCSQTEGDALPDVDMEATRWIEALPLIDVARSWGLSVESYNGRPGAALGKYRHRSAIAVGVSNLSTWTHELVHAADDRCIGGIKGGQHLDQEVVAELGGAVLLECLGHSVDSDRGGCWSYIASYAEREGKEPIAVCQRLLKRVCDAVAAILDQAEQLAGVATVEA